MDDIKIKENTTNWVVKKNLGKIEVSYSVPKELCPNEKDLKEYLKKEGLV